MARLFSAKGKLREMLEGAPAVPSRFSGDPADRSRLRRPEVTMDLYLMQHGSAVAEADDPARPLTDEGRAAVGRVAERARAAGVRLDMCIHSGKLRAEQSAQLLAAAIGVGDVQAAEGLAPNDPVAPAAQRLREFGPDDAVAVVGHLPFLGRLASLLITGDEALEVIRFRMGGLVKLVPTDDGARFAVAWVLPPELT